MSLVAMASAPTVEESVMRALDAINAPSRLPRRGLIIIKPNLTMARPPPVTTSVGVIAALVLYCREKTSAEIAIGEGSGDGETLTAYELNGYTELARRNDLKLIDFNNDPAVKLSDKSAFQLHEFYLPEICMNAFIISVPVLKDHSFTVTTISMKNMFGLAPARYYRGTWNKSRLHHPCTHLSVVDVCRYRKPDLCVVDATIALTGMHLSGIARRFDTILASFDPVAVDTVGSRMLGHDPLKIQYLIKAHGLLGDMENIQEVRI